jgi:hypothetical protein
MNSQANFACEETRCTDSFATDRPHWQKALFFDLKGVTFLQIASGIRRA